MRRRIKLVTRFSGSNCSPFRDENKKIIILFETRFKRNSKFKTQKEFKRFQIIK